MHVVVKCTQLHYISNDQNSKSIGSFIDLGILLVSPHCLQVNIHVA